MPSKMKALRPRDRILLSASQLFAQHGLHGVTIRDIAAGAGVQLPALYRAFANKEALYLAASQMVFGMSGVKYSKKLRRHAPGKQILFEHVVSVYNDLLDDDRLRKM
jgi:AcrR family transcriptional regulator